MGLHQKNIVPISLCETEDTLAFRMLLPYFVLEISCPFAGFPPLAVFRSCGFAAGAPSRREGNPERFTLLNRMSFGKFNWVNAYQKDEFANSIAKLQPFFSSSIA